MKLGKIFDFQFHGQTSKKFLTAVFPTSQARSRHFIKV